MLESVTALSRATRIDPRSALMSRFFQVLADPTRVRIVELLLEGEKNVSELVEALRAPQGRVSSHLMCLRWCGFIATRREGKYVYYRITDPRVPELMHLAHLLLADHDEAIACCGCLPAADAG
jgi:DNA-binding transcriptional ArsR family regulator